MRSEMASASRRPRTQFSIVVDDQKEPIGEGMFGVVFYGWFEGQPAAVKRIERIKLKDNNHEEDALRRLDHPNVLALWGVDEDDSFKYFALELCAGTVDEYCDGKYTGPMPTEAESLYQMASGLHYIHQHHFIHRDIKPENILISYPSPSIQLKISDFGFCKPVSVRGTMSLSGIRGTFRWLAPELLPFLGKECLSERGNISSDVFSMGCVFGYFLTRGIHPFGQEPWLVMARISEGMFDLTALNHMPTFQVIVNGMIQKDAGVRTKLEEVCALLQPPRTPTVTDRVLLSPVRKQQNQS